MKTFKKIDVAIQFVLIPIFIVLVCTNTSKHIFLSYFTVGTIQLISAIAHMLLKWQIAEKARKIYNISLLITAAGLLTFLFPQFAFFYLYFLLFFSPIMAICYFILSWHELVKLNERPLAILK